MNEKIKKLYDKHILGHSKNPFHEGILEEADVEVTAYNPMCGDKFTFYLKFDNDRIVDVYFQGFGCAISKASSSILTKNLVGKEKIEARALIEDFLKLISEDSDELPENITDDEELLAFEATREFPEREQCASLGWKELKKIL